MNLNIKYCPKTIEECYISEENKKKINRMIEKESFRNMIFYGDVGTGKSTVIKLILQSNQFKKTKILKINLLLDDLKKRMKSDIEEYYLYWKRRGYNTLILLENLDLVEVKFQMNINAFLNNINDNSLTFFIETNKIINIDKSVQNHTINILFETLNYNNYLEYLTKICKKENITIDNSIFNKLYLITRGDIRNTLNQLTILELCSNKGINPLLSLGESESNNNKNITLDLFESIFHFPSSNIINNIIQNLIKKQNYNDILSDCKILYDNKFSCNEILLSIFNMLFNYTDFELKNKMLLLEKISKSNYKILKYSNKVKDIDELFNIFIKVIDKLYNLKYEI